LLSFVQENPDCQLIDMKQHLLDKDGLDVSTSTISRTLHKLGWSLKTVTKAAREQDIQKQARYLAEVSLYEPHELVFIDESS
ncbi:hypothetical protein CPB86DRAFT_672381, partial [Serendipita vermifera]